MMGACKFSGNFPVCMGYSADHPFWIHLKSCQDCRALVHAHREFENPLDGVELAFDLDEADKELEGRIRSAISFVEHRPAMTKSPASSPRFWFRKEFWYSSAALLVVGAGMIFSQDLMMKSDPIFSTNSGLVRGSHSSAGSYFCHREPGLLQVSWPPEDHSDLTRIILFDGSMAELGSFSTEQPGPFLITDPILLESATFGQVIHLGQGDILNRGPLFAIPPRF